MAEIIKLEKKEDVKEYCCGNCSNETFLITSRGMECCVCTYIQDISEVEFIKAINPLDK